MINSAQTGENMVPVLYCDIDGTIRWGKDELGRFVNTAADVKVFDGVADLLWEYKRRGWKIVGVSNQGGIALGHMTMEDCIAAMAETHVQTRRAFDRLHWCRHHPDADTPEMSVCWCRKPKAGMVLEAAFIMAQETDELYPPHMGLFVGDRPEDKACADNAGLRFIDAAEWRTGLHLRGLEEMQAADILYEKLTTDVDQAPIKALVTKYMTNEELRRSVDQGLMTPDQVRAEFAKWTNVNFPSPEEVQGALVDAGVFSMDRRSARSALGSVFANMEDNGTDLSEPLSQDIIDWALNVTGVKDKVKTVPLIELEMGDEFVYDGRLFEMVSKDEAHIVANTVDKKTFSWFFWHPDLCDPNSTNIPWTTAVLTDA